jgi:hypothetical protein
MPSPTCVRLTVRPGAFIQCEGRVRKNILTRLIGNRFPVWRLVVCPRQDQLIKPVCARHCPAKAASGLNLRTGLERLLLGSGNGRRSSTAICAR